jgi:iron complex transport system substrate-binding protein
MPPRRLLLTFPLLLLALLVAGCGDGESGGGDSTGDRAAQAAAAADAFPVTIKHARGSTTITSEPKRIVTVGLRDQEPLLALGIKAVGAMDWFQQGTFAKWPWERARWGGKPPQVISTSGFDINFERVAAQRPDLILGVYQDIKPGDYKKLSRIAPTIAQSPDNKPYTTPWREETLTIAESVGRRAQAQQLIDAVDAKFATVRKEHPEFKGKEALIADPSGREIFAFTSVDPRGQFLAELGFESSKAIDKISKDGYGAEISDERLKLLDVDYLFLLIDKKIRDNVFEKPVFRRLDVVKRGDVVELPYYDPPQYGAAMAFNSVLSIPYAIDGTLRQIAAADRR